MSAIPKDMSRIYLAPGIARLLPCLILMANSIATYCCWQVSQRVACESVRMVMGVLGFLGSS